MGYPKSVLVPVLGADHAIHVEWLSALRGSNVDVRVPQRGDKRTLHDTVTMNAHEEFARHRMRRASDHNSRSRALTELQHHLELPEAPLRIECYDMAHLQGTDYVGSMVVLEDGLPAKREYRRFKVRDVAGNDDYAAMREVLSRRLRAYLDAQTDGVGGTETAGKKPGRFSYPPQLLLVDGGKGQLSVAIDVVRELGLEDEIPVAALAKRFEEVFVPGRSNPVAIPRGSEAMFMLQRIRDEAHRFANGYNALLYRRRMRESLLDDCPGISPAKKRLLLETFGSVARIRAAGAERIAALPGISAKTAEAIVEFLRKQE